MPRIIRNNLPFPESDLSDEMPNLALGRFMTIWGQIEVVCNFLFRRITDLEPDVSTIIFDNVGTKEQIEMLVSLCDFLPIPEQKDRIITLLDRTREFGIKRNKIVHASWGLLDGEPARFWSGMTSAHSDEIRRQTQKGKSLLQKFVFSASTLEALTAEMVSLREELEAALRVVEIPKGPRSRHFQESEARYREATERSRAMRDAITWKDIPL
jgi:hypothetical protein